MPLLKATDPRVHDTNSFRYFACSILECNFSPDGIVRTLERMRNPSHILRGELLESGIDFRGKYESCYALNDVGLIIDPSKLSIDDFICIDRKVGATVFRGNRDAAAQGVFCKADDKESRFRATLLSKKIYEITEQDPSLVELPVRCSVTQELSTIFGESNYNLYRQIVKEEYGDNRWWESDDPVEIAKNQIFERCLLVNFQKFHQGLEMILGRDLYPHELGLNIEGIRQEVRMGLRRLEKGVGTSDEYRQEAFRRSMQQLQDYCRKTGKTLSVTGDRDENGIDISGYDGWLN